MMRKRSTPDGLDQDLDLDVVVHSLLAPPMARTKQSTRKSTGSGTAQRKTLAAKAARRCKAMDDTKAESDSVTVTCSTSVSDESSVSRTDTTVSDGSAVSGTGSAERDALSLQILRDIPSPHPASPHAAPLRNPFSRVHTIPRKSSEAANPWGLGPTQQVLAEAPSALTSALARLPEEYCRTAWLGLAPTSRRQRDCLRGIDPPRLARIRPPPITLP